MSVYVTDSLYWRLTAVVDALRACRFCPECRYAMENHPTACGLGRALRALDAPVPQQAGKA